MTALTKQELAILHELVSNTPIHGTIKTLPNALGNMNALAQKLELMLQEVDEAHEQQSEKGDNS
jgi:DNA-binding ferritin-like protein